MKNIFLTFIILTYKRPTKVLRLLEQFLDTAWVELNDLNLEIVIADDHSNDNTFALIEPVIQKLKKNGWRLKYVYREKNLQADFNLFSALVNDAKGDYAWLLCDDDFLIVKEAIGFIKYVYKTKPRVAICGFSQGNILKYGNSLGSVPRTTISLEDSIYILCHYPKTSTYIVKRDLKFLIYEYFIRWDKTLFYWIGFSIQLISSYEGSGVSVYPNKTVVADNEYGILRYSYRVFGNLSYVVKDSLAITDLKFNNSLLKFEFLQNRDEIELCILGLQAHYSAKSEITYEHQILAKELKYLLDNLPKAFLTFPRIVLFVKFFVHFIFYKSRRMMSNI
jgi:glycosyltransferase involved in cell wall biosynthesis